MVTAELLPSTEPLLTPELFPNRFEFEEKIYGRPERDLVQDCVYLLQGIDGQYVKLNGTDLKMEPFALRLIDRIRSMGVAYKEIVDELKNVSTPSLLFLTFKTALVRHLRDYLAIAGLVDSKIDQWTFIGKLGPVIYQRKSYELRQDKHVVPAIAQVVEIYYKTKPIRNFGVGNAVDNYKNEIDFLIKNQFRNETIKKLSANCQNNALILVDYLEHGETIYKLLKNKLKEKKVFYITGEMDVEKREEIRKIMEHEKNVICVAISKIFSTGINIKNLHYIILGGGGKSKIKVLQSIGRGLRLHESKSTLYIVDIADQLYYGMQHQMKRQEFYEQENIPHQKVKTHER